MAWNTFVNLALAFFLIAFVASLIGNLFASKVWFRLVLPNLVLGWLGLSLSLGLRWHLAARAPLSNQYESMLFLLWAVLAIYFLFLSLSFFVVFEWLSLWVAGFALLSLGAVSLLDSSVQPLVPALQSNWLLIHVTTTLLGYAAFALAFLGGLVYLVSRKSAQEKDQALEPFLYRSLTLGFWLLALGIITGAVWANSAWGSYWSWDPKETWALVTWIFYAIAIHLRRTRGWRGSRFAWLAVGGFVFVIFTYFGVNYLLSGLHSYA